VYREIAPPNRLVYTWAWEDGGAAEMGETLVTVEFRGRESHTEIVLIHSLFPAEEAKQDHELGWNSYLNRLEAHCWASASGWRHRFDASPIASSPVPFLRGAGTDRLMERS